MEYRIILASKSPRRRELLENIGLTFEVMVDNSPEYADKSMPPGEYVQKIARVKLENVMRAVVDDEACGNLVIIAADTVVVFAGEILGKPEDKDDAFRMLKLLSRNTHEVYTGIAVLNPADNGVITHAEMTRVTFRELSDEEIASYVNTGEPMDKAGSYGIQNLGSLLVSKIEGDFFNVVGLPLCKLGNILSELGVSAI